MALSGDGGKGAASVPRSVSHQLVPKGNDMDGVGDSIKKSASASRFHVAPSPIDEGQSVDAAASKGQTNEGNPASVLHAVFADDVDDPDFGSKSPESPTTFSNSDSYRSFHPLDTNLKTQVMNTQEKIPCMEYYGNTFTKVRPTLEELHEEMENGEARPLGKDPLLPPRQAEVAVEDNMDYKPEGLLLGWKVGVLMRCLLNIWGVMLFLRISWIGGQAGIILAIVIILMATLVTVITSLSMSAICTNGIVRGGGAYYMISRSLGPEWGGAIGLIFYLANSMAVAMYAVGFGETVAEVMQGNGASITGSFMNDVRIISIASILGLFIIGLFGMKWESVAQFVLLVMLLAALANFFLGSIIRSAIPGGYDEDQQTRGIIGYTASIFAENWNPKFTDGYNFGTVFAIFFPAATGILAGANISGDLKNPSKSIPKGTLSAIAITSTSYVLMVVCVAGLGLREAVGVFADPDTLASLGVPVLPNKTHPELTLDNIRNCSLGLNGTCHGGLLHDYQFIAKSSGISHIITAGIFAATLSSALASLISAPKVLQAVAKDKIFPYISALSGGWNKSSDFPMYAYILTLLISLGMAAIGDLNLIAPLISIFFLFAYCLINYSCFDASCAKSPGWRPSFKFYSRYMSLVGSLICVAICFAIHIWFSLATAALGLALYKFIKFRKPNVNWGSSAQAKVYKDALALSIRLITTEDHIKNYRPNILVLSGNPEDRPALVDFVHHVTKKCSLMVCGHVMVGTMAENVKALRHDQGRDYLMRKHKGAFYAAHTSPSLRLGIQGLLQLVGLGKMKPNVVILGFKKDWMTCDSAEVVDYVNIIHDSFDLNFGVGVLRFSSNVQRTYSAEGDDEEYDMEGSGSEMEEKSDSEDGGPAEEGHGEPVGTMVEMQETGNGDSHKVSALPNYGPQETVRGLKYLSAGLLRRKRYTGTIDVWWLFDDGGLTILLPQILASKKRWSGCKLRIFTAGTKKGQVDKEQRKLAGLLSKFRIGAQDTTVLATINSPPSRDSIHQFNHMIKDWILNEAAGETEKDFPWKISKSELQMLKQKTYRHIKIRELVMEHSSEANLIVMTLPMPRKGSCSPGLYMAWLETLTADMPNMLLLRGNQESVLTYYS